jgi:hypothetical protein
MQPSMAFGARIARPRQCGRASASAFAVIDSALGNLETMVGMKFNATTLSQR